MADNTGEEHLDSSTNAPPDKLSDDIIPSQVTENISLNQETENMEVHKHPHHVTHKKKWGEYLLEFFMLFLAVFLGFVAENFREHQVEQQREKQYIRSFIGDLQSDTAAITLNIDAKLQKNKLYDSVIWYLNTPDPNQYSQRIYFMARQLTRTTTFYRGTIKQLKNSGDLRLISNQSVSDSILSYDKAIEGIELIQARQDDEVKTIRPMIGRLLDPNVLETMIDENLIHPPSGNPPLRTVNKEFILDFIYAIHQIKSSDILNASRLKKLNEKAIGIIQFLQKEYHLQ